MSFVKHRAAGSASVDFSPNPMDGSSDAIFQFFRNTSTTGDKELRIMKGDGTNTTIHIIRSNSTTIFNDQGDDLNMRIEGNTDTNLLMVDAGLDAVGIGVGSNSQKAKLHVDQKSTSGNKPPLYLDQADVSEEMIEFATTIGVGNAIEAVGVKTLTATHFIKCTIAGVGSGYLAFGDIA